MIYSISYTFTSYGAGKLSDKLGISKVLVFGYIILIISYIGMAWAHSPLTLGIFFAIMGIFSSCTDATQRSFVAHSVPEYERGTAYGLFNGAIGFGAMVSGIVGGMIWQHVSAEFALLVAGVVVFLGLIMFGISRRV